MIHRLACLLAAAAFGACLTASSAAALDSSGPARVVDADGRPLRSGNASTAFTIALPDGAECQGDSRDGGYRVESFLLPLRHDPAAMQWGELAPTAPGSWALYDTMTNPYVHRLTAVATEKGGPGAIANTGMFSFAPFLDAPEVLASGRYHVGLACSRLSDTTRFWSTEMRVDVDASRAEESERVRWSVAFPSESADSSKSSAIGAAAVAGVLAAGVFVRRRVARARTMVTA